jgi:hypothetical protein
VSANATAGDFQFGGEIAVPPRLRAPARCWKPETSAYICRRIIRNAYESTSTAALLEGLRRYKESRHDTHLVAPVGIGNATFPNLET